MCRGCAAPCSLRVEDYFLSRFARNSPAFTFPGNSASSAATKGHDLLMTTEISMGVKRPRFNGFLIFSYCPL